MATYLAAIAQSRTSAFRERVWAAMTQCAIDVGGEVDTTPNYARRQAFSRAVLQHPLDYLDSVCVAVALGDVTDASPDTGAGSVYERCAAVFNDFAGWT